MGGTPNGYHTLMVEACRRWVEEVVLKLNLCPFAHAPWAAGEVRFVASRADSAEELLAELFHEASVATGTTLLCTDRFGFEELHNIAGIGEQLLPDWQVVAFHPDFRFEGSDPDDPANGVNRSPHGMLHLIRRADIAAVVAASPNIDDIPFRNAEKLRKLEEP
jgi:uncharacterized protein